MGDDNGLGIIFFFAFMLGFLCGGCVMVECDHDEWQIEAIKHNAGHFHPETGAFTWNDEKD